MHKKKWVSPEIQILTRSKPEESILEACKGDLNPIGSNQAFGNCAVSCGTPCYAMWGS